MGMSLGFALGLATALAVTKAPERRGVILQCSFRSNLAIIGLSPASTLGGDEQLATQLVVWTSIFSIVTIFAEVCILMGVGLLAV